MRIEFLDPAKKEFAEAIAYYNQESEGLGYRFAAEVRRTLSRIRQYPHMRGLQSQSVHAVVEHVDFPTALSTRPARM